MRSVLVLRGGALGDFLLTLPLLRTLRAAFPTARIELVGNAAAAQLAVDAGIIDSVHSQHEARWAALYGDPPLPEPLAAIVTDFDLVIVGWPDADGAVMRHFPRRAGQRALRIDPAPGAGPVWRQWVDAVAAIAPADRQDPADFTPLDPGPEATERARNQITLPSPFIALHPGSGSPTKNAPPELWLELIDRLDSVPLLVVLGEADTPLAARFRTLASSRIQIAEQWDLPLLAAALARASAYAGHDTGVTHLAAAVGTPVHALFGPTDPRQWAPLGRTVRILRFDPQRTTCDPAALARALRAGRAESAE